MKVVSWLILCLASAVAFFAGCNKNDTGKHTGSDKTSIIGSWELRTTSGGMMPGEKQYPAGNANTFVFSEQQYKAYSNGSLTNSGRYSIVNDPTVEQATCLDLPAGQYSNRLILDGWTATGKLFIQITGDKLVFLSGCYAIDAGQRVEYQRQ